MLRISNHYISRTVFLLFSTEIFVLMVIFYISILLRFPDTEDVRVSFETSTFFLPEAATFAILMTLSMAATGMYQFRIQTRYQSHSNSSLAFYSAEFLV